MAKFLSDEWLDDVRTRATGASAGDLTATVQIAAGKQAFFVVVVDGKVVEIGSGTNADADVSLTLPADVAVAVAARDLAPSVAFMQGRMKTAGEPGKLLDVLACTARPGFAAFRDALAADTEF